MVSRGRRCRGCPRGASQAPPVSDQRAFAEAIGVATAALIQASAVESEEGPSDLQGFQAHHPPTCIGGGDSRSGQPGPVKEKEMTYKASRIEALELRGRSIFFQPEKEAEDFCFARISRTGPRSSGPRPGWDI